MAYRVKTVCERTGIARNTLLAWERRYGVPGPARTEGGYRLYSDADLAWLLELKSLTDQGLSISEAIARSRRPPQAGMAEASPQSPQRTVDELLAPLLRYDLARAEVPLRWVSQVPLDEAITEIWVPLLRRTGELWERGEISVVQEHFVSALAREHVQAWFRALGTTGSGPRAVCACAPDEEHDLPLLLTATQLRRLAWRVAWLGARVPLSDLLGYVSTQRPDVICLSSSAPGSGPAMVAEAQALVEHAPEHTVVALGGSGVAGLPPTPAPRVWACTTASELATRWNGRGA